MYIVESLWTSLAQTGDAIKQAMTICLIYTSLYVFFWDQIVTVCINRVNKVQLNIYLIHCIVYV